MYWLALVSSAGYYADHDFIARVRRSETPRSGFVQRTDYIRSGPD